MRPLFFSGFFSALCLWLVSGCGPAEPKLYPVKGSVTVKGKPAANAIVFMHRKERSSMNEAVPFGTAGPDGTYSIMSDSTREGALPGEYLLTVVWPDMSKEPDGNGQRPDLLNGAYELPGQSKLTATVKAEANVLPPIDLTPGPPVRKAPDKNAK